MIFKEGELVLHRAEIEIPQLGGAMAKGYANAQLHKPTGTMIVGRFYNDDTLDKFVVGYLKQDGDLEEEREFAQNTEEDFNNAVAYFEELIQKKKDKEGEGGTPPPPAPSMGQFYYLHHIKKPSFARIMGVMEIEIRSEDLPVVLSTPTIDKPYGMLDVTSKINEKDDYRLLNAKFILVYNEQETLAYANEIGVVSSLIGVYDMMPFSTAPSRETEPPKGVNPPPKDGKTPPPPQPPRGRGKGKPVHGKPDKHDKIEYRHITKGHFPPDKEDEDDDEPKTGGLFHGKKEFGDTGELQKEKEPRRSSSNLIEALKQMLGTSDLKQAVRGNQASLLNLIRSYSKEELEQELYPSAGVPSSMSKEEFIKLVERETKYIFQ